MARGPLADLKVVELAELISGPYCTKLLADLGAEVIKVETPQVGDISRRLGPFPNDIPQGEKSGAFIYLNTNKLGVTLDINKAEGRKILKELLRDADVFVEANPRKLMLDLKLDYLSLMRINPQFVMTSITPFGHTGPYRDYKGYDINIPAAGGFSYRLGFPDRMPLNLPANQSSYYAAVTGAAATMLAVYARDFGKLGQHVDISQVRCLATTLSIGATRFLTDQASAARVGRQMPGHFPFTTVPVKDGTVLVGAVTPDEWKLITKMIGKPELGMDPRFQTALDRYKYREELMSQMEPWFLSHTKAEIVKSAMALRATGLCVPMQTVEEMLESHQLKARDFFVEIEHPQVGKLTCLGPPYKLSETPWSIRRPAPGLGEHNEEIYCGSLGYSKDDICKLRYSGIV